MLSGVDMIRTIVRGCLLNAGGTADNEYSPRNVSDYIPGLSSYQDTKKELRVDATGVQR